MDEAQLKAFLNGPVPDDSQCREVAEEDLDPSQCGQEISHGLPSGRTYCGAPKTEGFILCRYHLFDALYSGYPVEDLRE